MKVRELIEKLKEIEKADPEMEVFGYEGDPIEFVKVDNLNNVVFVS